MSFLYAKDFLGSRTEPFDSFVTEVFSAGFEKKILKNFNGLFELKF